MSKIANIFQNLKQKKQKAFIPFVTAGDGGIDLTLEIMLTLVKNGADIIELGVPFSDPMADGEIIAKSHQRAVSNNIGLKDILLLVKQFREVNQTTAIVLMGYLNPIEIYGYKNFAIDGSEAGIDGVLIVDNPPEEAFELKKELDKNSIDFIFLIAPTTTDERIKYLSKLVSGFVYFVSLKGITGANNLDIDLVNSNLSRIKKYINLPVCVGFGIKDADTAKKVSQNAEGVIIGSSLVKFIEQSNNKNNLLLDIGNFSLKISEAIK